MRLLVQRQRAPFLTVKQEIREQGVQYALLFPAKLRVIVEGNTKFFTDAKEAWDWLELYKAGKEGTWSGTQGEEDFALEEA